MEKNQIPGIAVGLVLQGQTYVFNYGMASVEGQRRVTDATIFEIGSVSKTFTATLTTYAEATGKLELSDMVANYLPELADTDFGRLQLYHLGTHTTGGLPLQVPDEIQTEEQLMSYFRAWKPPYKTGAVRTYANPSIGTLGLIAARSLHQDFGAAMSHEIFQPLGLESTYLSVPSEKLSSYAFGYTKDKVPVRVNPGMLSNEAYGVKTTARDLTRFLKANMGMLQLGSTLQTALKNTRKGYFKVGDMTQDLIWEEYALPVDLQVLQHGNSAALIYNPTPVVAQVPPSSPRPDVWVNKTGSTNGFGAYVAFVPSKHFGIVVLANKNYPNEERVEIAHKIFEALSR
ncbi:beta-lactamase family protein [Collimonas arenae]|uniref:Beta-lactamase n=2 Tax=Collimonas arenae TaxID=279058 RepID=A0A127QIV7_9BURK|nr:beta-lactamase family protein [Collimonas arenae]